VDLLKKSRVVLLVFLALILFNTAVFSKDNGDVYIIPIKGEINKATYNYLNSTIKDIEKKHKEMTKRMHIICVLFKCRKCLG